MKRLGLLSVSVFLIVGCGGNGNSTPARDGKGDIDVVDYLANQSMIKELIGGISGQSSSMKKQTINVIREINTITEESNFTEYMFGRVTETDALTITTYNDKNITIKIHNQADKIKYRFVDIGEIESDYYKKILKDYINDVNNIVIGTEEYEVSKKCVYTKPDKIIFYDEVKRQGDFLNIQCKNIITNAYHINNDFLDLDESYRMKNNKHDIIEIETNEYYEKNVGYIGYFDTTKRTSKPCSQDNSCEYSNIVDTDYMFIK